MENNEQIDKILQEGRNFLKGNNEFEKFSVAILFTDEENNDNVIIAFDENFEVGITFHIKDFSYEYLYSYDFDFDTDIFKILEEGKNIGFVSFIENQNIWSHLQALGLHSIENKIGLKKYIDYCKENGITKEYFTSKGVEKMPDILQYYYYQEKIQKENMTISEDTSLSIEHIVDMLENNEECVGAEIVYLLIPSKDMDEEKIAVVTTKNGDLYEVNLKKKEINYLMDWAYNFDDEIFGNLEKKYDIGYMNMEVHYAIWSNLEEIGIEEIEHKVGLQKYLKFCKENNIDKKAIDTQLGKDVADAMKYYDSKNDFVVIENDEVKIPRKIYQKENDIDYIKFCLGYDLLNGMLSKSETSECDISYDFCDYLARKFVKTDYYKNEFKSTYDNLQE